MSIVIRRKLFDYMADSLAETEFCFPILDPAMCQFLYDLNLEPLHEQAWHAILQG